MKRGSFLRIISVISLLLYAFSSPAIDNTQLSVQRIKIGVLLPLSGNAASYGEQFRRGIEIAQSTTPAKIIYEDTRFESATALSAYKKLTQVDKVDLLISFGGATCEVINRAAQADQIVHIAAGCNTAEFKNPNSYNFRLDVNEAIAAKKTADYIRNQGIDSVAYIYVQNSWAETIIQYARDAFLRSKIDNVAEITFSESSSLDIRSQLIKLSHQKPKSIFLISLPDLTPTVLKQIKEANIKAPIFSNISIENPEVVRLAGTNAEGIRYLSVQTSAASRSTHPDFYKQFPDGNPFAAWGYDSILLLSQVSRSAEPHKTLQTLHGFVGAFNLYQFDHSGELSLPYEFKQIQNGVYQTISH